MFGLAIYWYLLFALSIEFYDGVLYFGSLHHGYSILFSIRAKPRFFSFTFSCWLFMFRQDLDNSYFRSYIKKTQNLHEGL